LARFGRAFAVRAIEANRFKVRVLATTLALAYVARGRLAAAVYARSGLAVHFAAGLLLAEEAGAQVTDHLGQPWRIDSPIYLAAADQTLHTELCGMAQQVVAALGSSPGS
jgi:myo-inositol-1(or 4)-monophosphatase